MEVGDGSVLGVAEVGSISLSDDVPQFKKKESAAGRVAADEDGTTHELAGGWNANSAPIHVWRRTDGRLEVISGRHRLAHARRNGVRLIQVRVYDESAAHDSGWAKLHDVEQNILDNTCNAIDVAYYFRHNPLSMAEAEARGLLPKTKAGEQTAASRIGLTVAAHASDDTFALLVNGKCSAEDAYMACLVSASDDGQRLALEARAGKNGKRNSWEYVTALVRGAEQMRPDDGGMLDLFGNDALFRERSEKLARFVAAVRDGLKARISIFVNSSKLNRRADVARELGVRVDTPEDATRLISRLARLDAAYERLDPELGIPAMAEAWDGKSAVPTSLDELAAGSSFSLSESFDVANPDITFSLAGSRKQVVVSQEMDARYMSAVERGDMETAQRMVDALARARGYLPDSNYQGSVAFNGSAPSSNGYFETAEERREAWENGELEGDVSLADFVRRGIDPWQLEWMVTSPVEYRRADEYRRESIEAIRKAKASKRGKVTIYRAVPAEVQEKSVRNGDWVTLSKDYAEMHSTLQSWDAARIISQEVSLEDLWWDGNDVNEWGYDDGKAYGYRNTANNRKLLDAVTYDRNGDVVPLSKRFNVRSANVSFSLESVMTDWKNTLEAYLKNPPLPGTPAHTHDLVVCPTPAVMRMVGARGWDMVVTPGVLDKVMKGKHAVSAAALEQLPAALSDPICIAVSDTPGCMEVVTELKEGLHNVLVAVQLDSSSSEKKEVKVNRIASIYGKEKIASLLSHPMLYWDKAKARVWMQAYRLQLPAQVLPKRAFGKKILKPADLVKYKEENSLSFSLSGLGMIDAADLGAMSREQQLQRLVNHARREAARWERTFAEDTPNAKAAEAMGAAAEDAGG